MGVNVGTIALLFTKVYKCKLATGIVNSIRSKNNRSRFMLAQSIICICISQLLLQSATGLGRFPGSPPSPMIL